MDATPTLRLTKAPAEVVLRPGRAGCRRLNVRRWQQFQGQPARLLVAVDLSGILFLAERCLPSSSPMTPADRFLQGRDPVSGAGRLSGGKVRRLLCRHRLLRDPFIQEEIEANGWMIWPPIRYSYTTANSYASHAAPDPPFWLLAARRPAPAYPSRPEEAYCTPATPLAGHRRSGPRCAGAADLRLPAVGAVRPDADASLLGDRHRGGCGAGLFRRLDRPLFQRFIEIWTSMPSLYLLLIIAAVFVPGFWTLLVHPASVFLGGACRPCAGGVPARAQFEYVAPRGRWAVGTARSCSATCCPTPWWRR
jgi:hypothetical protein